MTRGWRVAIAGAGAFGTALSLVAARDWQEVRLLARNEAHAQALRDTRESRHLPGIAIPPEIGVSADPRTITEADMLLLAAPAQATRELLAKLAGHIAAGIPVVACAKGIEQRTGSLQSEIIRHIAPAAIPACLSGPGFAEEIARGQPTAVTIGAPDLSVARRLAGALSSESFRPYATDDVAGVELGGAVKNVLAIACGIVEGRRLGESARAALIARGLAEMMRLGVALGARAETFMGLSGLGDLVLTATAGRSRNRAFGEALGRGEDPATLLAAGRPLVEGAHTARIASELSVKNRVDAPVVAAVAAVLEGATTVDAAIEGLVSRPLKEETA